MGSSRPGFWLPSCPLKNRPWLVLPAPQDQAGIGDLPTHRLTQACQYLYTVSVCPLVYVKQVAPVVRAGSLCHRTVCVCPISTGNATCLWPPGMGRTWLVGNGRVSRIARIGSACCAHVHTHTHTQNTQTQTYRHTDTCTDTETQTCTNSHLVCGSVTGSPEPAEPPQQDTRLLGGMTLSAKMAPYLPPAISEAARGPWVGPGQVRASGG